MKVYLDMSVFLGDGSFYGVISGKVEMQNFPKQGDPIALLDEASSSKYGLPVNFIVQHITPVNGYDANESVVSLGDIVIDSIDKANRFAAYMERCWQLYCDR